MAKGLVPAGCLEELLEAQGQEIFSPCWLSRHAWHQLVTDPWTDACQCVALACRLEQSPCFATQVLCESLCQSRMHPEGASAVVSLTEAFHLAHTSLGANQQGSQYVLTTGSSCSSYFSHHKVGENPQLFTIQNTQATFEGLALPGSPSALKAPWTQLFLIPRAPWPSALPATALSNSRPKSGASVSGGPPLTSC